MSQELLDAIRAVGFNPPPYIKNSAITRFQTTGKDKSGWVSMFSDGKGAAFGDWKSGEVHYWFLNGQAAASDYDREEALKKAKEERDFAYASAAFNAQELYAKLPTIENHDYLIRKNIKSDSGLRLYDNRLVVPVYGANEEIQSLQFISADGDKRFYTGGKMHGGYYVIGSLGDTVLITEGFATGMTLHEATGFCVVVAFNAGNLKPVCDMIRKEYKGRVLICADNDASGVGVEKASKCGVEVIYPPIVGEDFNDMANNAGIESVYNFVCGRKQSLFVSVQELMTKMKPADWVIKDVLERGSSTLLFGESGSCKSLVALDWAFCIGNGITWHGRMTKKGLVIYIAGEGHRGLAMRMQALKQKYSRDPDNIYFSTKSVNMLSADAVQQIIQIIAEITDQEPYAIFIDTLHRNMHGDENSSEDMAMYLSNIEMLTKKYTSAIVTVHHSGHGDKGRARGSSAIKAGMDAEFCMTKKSKMEVTFSCTKSKDFAAGSNMEFALKIVPLEGECFYDDYLQEQIDGVYLEYVGVAQEEALLKPATQKCLDGLKKAIAATQNLGGSRTLLGEREFVVSREEWRPFAYEEIKSNNSKSNSNRFNEGLKDLEKQGLVIHDAGYYWLRKDVP